MRYQDWDVLLFPQGSTVPIKEFKTACFAVQDGNEVTPLLTSFVPSLARGVPFQISIHSWTKPKLFSEATTAVDDFASKGVWQVRVLIDGICVASETISSDVCWPQIVNSASTCATDGRHDHLRFPPFNRAVLSESHWDATEDVGRIKIALSQGYEIHRDGKVAFLKHSTVACYSFQPAPNELLERSGIAWPNPSMFSNPLHNSSYNYGSSYAASQHPQTASEPLRYSSSGFNSLTSPAGHVPGPPPPTPVNGSYSFRAANTSDPYAGFYDLNSSRSTSTYSSLSSNFDALPLAYSDASAIGHKKQVELRLRSDQLRQIINALSPPKVEQSASSAATAAMPPPPLPLTKTPAAAKQRTSSYTTTATEQGPLTAIRDAAGRHGESRCSDISMHASCTSFPDCFHEDLEGKIIHLNAAEAAYIKGRKEGNSPTRTRDFLSKILDPPAPPSATDATHASLLSSSPAEGSGKKRTRSALRSLAINDSSPEKKQSPSKPLRKSSRVSSSNKENEMVIDVDEDKENEMIDV